MYRGIGLPKSAIDTYRLLQQKDQEFMFSGFTSTSKKKSVAEYFAKKAVKNKKDLVPVIFDINLRDTGDCYANLNNGYMSAYHEEDEILIGACCFLVKKIEKSNGYVVIYL